MKTICVTNDKGGVGKTTTVANLSVGLAQRGCKTLVIDMDPQADVTFAILGARPPLMTKDKPLPRTVHGLLLEKYTFSEVCIKAPRYENLFIIPSNSDLAHASSQLVNQPGSQTVLLQILRNIPPESYDFVLIDTGKGLDLLVINALAAADEVIIMVTPGALELEAVKRMMKHVELVRTRTLLNADHPTVAGILLTNADHHSVAKDTTAEIEQLYPGLLLETIIPKNDDLKKAISRAKSVFEFNMQSRGAHAYDSLVKEVVNHGQQTER